MIYLMQCGEVVQHALQFILQDSLPFDNQFPQVQQHEGTQLDDLITSWARSIWDGNNVSTCIERPPNPYPKCSLLHCQLHVHFAVVW